VNTSCRGQWVSPPRPDVISILRFDGFVPGFFGRITSSTPLSSLLWILSASTSLAAAQDQRKPHAHHAARAFQ